MQFADGGPVDAGPPRYELTLRVRLDPSWSDWFEGLQPRATARGQTILSGTLPDQAALFGVLERIRDLGIELVELRRVD